LRCVWDGGGSGAGQWVHGQVLIIGRALTSDGYGRPFLGAHPRRGRRRFVKGIRAFFDGCCRDQRWRQDLPFGDESIFWPRGEVPGGDPVSAFGRTLLELA